MSVRSNTPVGDDGIVTGSKRRKKQEGDFGIEERYTGDLRWLGPRNEWRVRGWYRSEHDRDHVIEKERRVLGGMGFEFRPINRRATDERR
jgi:hypothetical protein